MFVKRDGQKCQMRWSEMSRKMVKTLKRDGQDIKQDGSYNKREDGQDRKYQTGSKQYQKLSKNKKKKFFIKSYK